MKYDVDNQFQNIIEIFIISFFKFFLYWWYTYNAHANMHLFYISICIFLNVIFVPIPLGDIQH